MFKFWRKKNIGIILFPVGIEILVMDINLGFLLSNINVGTFSKTSCRIITKVVVYTETSENMFKESHREREKREGERGSKEGGPKIQGLQGLDEDKQWRHCALPSLAPPSLPHPSRAALSVQIIVAAHSSGDAFCGFVHF